MHVCEPTSTAWETARKDTSLGHPEPLNLWFWLSLHEWWGKAKLRDMLPSGTEKEAAVCHGQPGVPQRWKMCWPCCTWWLSSTRQCTDQLPIWLGGWQRGNSRHPHLTPLPLSPSSLIPLLGCSPAKPPFPAFGQVPGLKQEPVRAQEVCASLALLPAPLLLAIAGCATAMAISHCTSCSPWLPRVFRRLSADWMLNLAEVAFRKQPAG